MADINFDCPHCGHNLEVSERGAGLTVACPECSKNIEIPIPAPELLMRDIIFNCGSCGQPLKAAPDMAGQLIDCPSCKKPTEIPFASGLTPATPTSSAARSTPIPKPPSQKQVPGTGMAAPVASVATSSDLSTDHRSHVTSPSSSSGGLGWFLIAVGIAAIILGLILNQRCTDQAKMFKDEADEMYSRYANCEYPSVRKGYDKLWGKYLLDARKAKAKGEWMIVLAVSGGFVIALGGWLITPKKS
jgi:phage FluMu protein Com